MNMIFKLGRGMWDASECEQKTNMFIPFFRCISARVVAVKPDGDRDNTVAFGQLAPSISNSRVGKSPTRFYTVLIDES